MVCSKGFRCAWESLFDLTSSLGSPASLPEKNKGNYASNVAISSGLGARRSQAINQVGRVGTRPLVGETLSSAFR